MCSKFLVIFFKRGTNTKYNFWKCWCTLSNTQVFLWVHTINKYLSKKKFYKCALTNVFTTVYLCSQDTDGFCMVNSEVSPVNCVLPYKSTEWWCDEQIWNQTTLKFDQTQSDLIHNGSFQLKLMVLIMFCQNLCQILMAKYICWKPLA